MPAENQSDPKIQARLKPEVRAALTRLHRLHGTSDTTVLQELIPAWVDYVERTGRTLLPVRVEHDAAGAKELLMAAEDPGVYGKHAAAPRGSKGVRE